LRPRHDLLQPALQAGYLRRADVCERGDGVAVQRAEGDLVEVDEADFATAGTRQGGCCVGADAAAADDDDEGVAQFGEAFVGQEDAVAGELLED
jgi:hypothetical protein